MTFYFILLFILFQMDYFFILFSYHVQATVIEIED